MTFDLSPDCNFSGVAFLAEETGPLARATFGSGRQLVTRHVPYGSRTIVQDLGAEAVQVSYNLILQKSDLAALRAKVGTTGTLSIVGESARSGVLLMPLGTVTVDDANGLAFVTATFMTVG